MQEAISVSKYSNYIKQIFDAEEFLHNIKVVGEVFGVSFSRQVAYFSLKDEYASISCVCFYPQISKEIKEGDLIVVTGSPNYYSKSGKLSFNVVDIKPAGQGILFQRFIELKQELEKKGLFSKDHKIEIPKKIKRIGVITSKDGAVIKDIINVATRRNPSVDIVLFPTKVQGNGAEDEISMAIEKFDAYEKIDVIILARGGGSLEDLWAYNTEKVACAIYNAKKPIVSAVGHETDFTIADFVADLRAPTPSAAAELLTENIQEKKVFFNQIITRVIDATQKYIFSKKSELQKNASSLNHLIENIEIASRLNLEKTILSLQNSMDYFINNSSYTLGILENLIKSLSPYDILKRGYAKIEQEGKAIDKIKDLVLSSELDIYLQDGIIKATAKKVEERNEIWRRN